VETVLSDLVDDSVDGVSLFIGQRHASQLDTAAMTAGALRRL
jgi:hypothetical protein